MNIRLSDATKRYIVGRHDEATSTINSAAGSVPTAVDAGLGSAEVIAIIEAAVSGASDLGDINMLVGGIVGEVGGHIQKTDAEVADELEKVADVHVEAIKNPGKG